MPSRAESRAVVEWVLRVALLALLALALWQSMRPAGTRGAVLRTDARTLDTALVRVLQRPEIRTVAHSATQSLSATQREVLVAMRRAGLVVPWSGEVAPLALQVVRDRDPLEGSTLRMAGGTSAVISDSAGVIDTLHSGAAALSVSTALVGAVRASDAGATASARVPAASARRAVLVLGRADWESKFVMSALTETGWQVRARIPAAPGVDIRDNGLLPIDTGRYDAVIALDTSAALFASEIARFVSTGGGLIVGGNALGVASLRGLSPGGARERIPGKILLTEDTVTLRDLPLMPLDNVRGDAVSLERQQAGVALAARRAGEGRVLAMGYDESWRWRMLGGESGLASHRDWWSRAVASVSPERADSIPSGIDAAPRVAMLVSLGASTAELPRGISPTERAGLPFWMLLVAIGAALGEIASRRFRGER